jgi:hypothetical protein
VSSGLFNVAGGVGCIALGLGALVVVILLLVIIFKVF